MSYPSSPFWSPVPPLVRAAPPPWAYRPAAAPVWVSAPHRWRWALILLPLWLPAAWVVVCLAAVASPVLVPGGIGALTALTVTSRVGKPRRHRRRSHRTARRRTR